MRSSLHWIILLFLLTIGFASAYLLYSVNLENEKTKRAERLQKVHSQAVRILDIEINKLASFVSSMRSYLNQSQQMPTQDQYQQFVIEQFKGVNSHDSIAVAFVDTTYTFRQAFTLSEIDPAKLVGRSIIKIRKDNQLKKLKNLLKTDSLRMFPPINLVEGWLGLPIAFRVVRDGVPTGYMAANIGFKNVMSSVYNTKTNYEFVFRFQTEEGHDFDRSRIHNGSKVYNDYEDEEYYKKFNLKEDDFIYSTLNNYGYKLKLGTAYRNPKINDNGYLEKVILISSLIGLLLFFLTFQYDKQQRLNNQLEIANSEIELQNDKLTRLNATKNKFFSIIGHDLKQPLHGIKGLLQILDYENNKDPELEEIILQLRTSINNSTELLNNLLKWALSQTGEIEYKPAKLYSSTILNDAVDAVYQQSTNKRIEVSKYFNDNVNLYGDSNMLQTIFRNLLSNAIKYSKVGSEVEVFSEAVDGNLIVKVRDYGMGMNKETLKSIFYLSEETNRSKRGTAGELGTGLGLVLVQDFVEKHNGTIGVESELGKGTTFTVKLPIA